MVGSSGVESIIRMVRLTISTSPQRRINSLPSGCLTVDNLLQKYKKWTQKQYNKYYYEYEFKPNFKWNIFDTNNDWVYDLNKWREFIWGWQSVGYAFEAWTYWMRDMKYQYKLPYAMWSELNDGYMEMYVYSWSKNK